MLVDLQSNSRDLDASVESLRSILAQYPFVFDAWRILILALSNTGRILRSSMRWRTRYEVCIHGMDV